jgi:signal transduction histidine kinase
MKLFRKTLIFFVGAIVFQSILSMLLITNVTRRANLTDAQRELESEASILYDGLNSWKRQIWISLVQIGADAGITWESTAERDRSLMQMLLSSKVDALVVKNNGGMVTAMVQSHPGTWFMTDMADLKNAKEQPYIETMPVGGTLCIVGVTTVAQPRGKRAQVFLLKRIDEEFCAQLTLNRRSFVAIFLDTALLVSTLPEGHAPSFFNPRVLSSSYRELYDQKMAGGHFNAAFQRLGRLGVTDEGTELFLGTFLSTAPYDQKLLELDKAILAVSLAGALMTVLLSLYLSRNITHPIEDLRVGMQKIRNGEWETRVHIRGGHEIGRLFEGFNEMAHDLAKSRAAMHSALAETVLLKEYSEKIVNSIRAGIAIVNSDLVVEKANSSFLSTFGLDGARTIGAPLTYLDIDIIDEVVVEKILSIFRRQSEFHSQVSRARGGRVFEIRLYPFYSSEREFHEASGCVFMVDDITARMELEGKFFQAEKLSTISMLSAGMAHEINNPLGSILTNVQNLIDEESSPERRVSLRWIEQETRRIARIVQELLNFAAADLDHAQGSDVNGVVQEVVGLVRHSLAREDRIRIDMRLEPHLPPSVVCTDELKQVVINLLRNSLQAIAAEGRVLVSTRRDVNGGITLVVADTGNGIPKEIISRIFDPFFTTKANGAGTGLGLSVVYGIISKNNGSIDVKSREGRGTRFCLRLPCMAAVSSAIARTGASGGAG